MFLVYKSEAVAGAPRQKQRQTWEYGIPLKYNRQEEEQEMNLKPHRLFGNLFMMSCSISLNVSKKSTASSTPSDIGEEAARSYVIPWIRGIHNLAL